jgi:CHASE2 domain-containing sensor protein
MKRLIAFFLGLAACIGSFAESPFVVVMYDQKSEQLIAPFPVDRARYAEALAVLKEDGARAVVFKFFFDQPKNGDSDLKLEESLKLLPVFLQARIDNSEPNANGLADRFYLELDGKFRAALSGDSGWLPLPQFAENAAGIGFVDIRKTDSVPIVEMYKGRPVPSLGYAILAYCLPNLRIDKGRLVNGERTIKIGDNGEVAVRYPKQDNLTAFSFYDLVTRRLDPSLFADKIVIIGYDGEAMDKLKTPIGMVKSHRVFIYTLYDLYERLR